MTPAKIATMPSKGTTRRSIRVPDDEWEPFVAKAVDEGTDASAKIRDFIRADLTTPEPSKAAPATGKSDEGESEYEERN